MQEVESNLGDPDDLERQLSDWAMSQRLSDAKAAAIRACILSESAQMTGALSYAWWRRMIREPLQALRQATLSGLPAESPG